MAQSRDFGLVKYEFKRVNGKGRRFIAWQTPAAFVNATRNEDLNPFEAGAVTAYLSAQAAGIVGQMNVDLPADGSDLDRAMALLDAYTFREIPTDDDGNELKPDEPSEPDPTAPSSPASAS